MKTVGLIGGTSWLSTIDYYRIMNQEVNRQLGGMHSAKLLLCSIDFDEFKTIADAGDCQKLTDWFATISKQLQGAGAEAIVLCAVTLLPDADERQYIHQTIFDQLDRGLLLQETKVRYLAIIQNLVDKGAEAVILGCTEIPLLIKPEDCKVPVFDTTMIHSKAAVRFALT